MDKNKYIIGVDLGGTNVRGGVFDIGGQMLGSHSAPSHGEKGGAKAYEAVTELISGLPARANCGWDRIAAIGIGSPGPIDSQKGVINFAPNIPDWIQFPLAKNLQDKFKVPAYLENDANLAAIGEHWKGAAQGMKNFIQLTLGTGIGGAIFIDGKLYLGSNGSAGEIGHMTVNPFGRTCGCGNIGCLEAHASGKAIARRFKALLEAGKKSQLAKTGEDSTFYAITEYAREGDPLCREVLTDAATYLGIAAASLINIFNPEAIVFSGRMIGAADILSHSVRMEIDRRALISSSETTKILLSNLGDDAGIFGAARWTLEKLGVKL